MPATDLTRGAMAGLRVVDLSRVLAGPLCTQMLADHGADVVKIEPPPGDETRGLGPPFDAAGEAAYFGAVNRGKRGMALDLSRAEGRAVLEGCSKDADVLVENFLPGTMERWGLGYEACWRRAFRGWSTAPSPASAPTVRWAGCPVTTRCCRRCAG